MGGRLYVDFCGDEHVVELGDRLSFGRGGDLVIDENPYMHRVVGLFSCRDGHWILSNEGSHIVLNVLDRTGPSSAVLAPGRSLGLTMAEFAVGFVAGRTRYEIDAALEGVADPAEQGAEVEGQKTLDWGVVELNAEQRLLLVDLASDRLADPHTEVDPPSRAVCARRLRWSLSKYNRKLDHLCLKLDRAGVQGLCGTEGAQATDRRRRLVDHAIGVGLVTTADLELLAPPSAAAPSA
ncbi:MAG: hypothetical protein ACK5O2_10810 [Microthrixaceae bacterium]